MVTNMFGAENVEPPVYSHDLNESSENNGREDPSRERLWQPRI
jgi:hypothetical protein